MKKGIFETNTKAFIKAINSAYNGYSNYQFFNDFLDFSISLINISAKRNIKENRVLLGSLSKKHRKEDFDLFKKLFDLVVKGLRGSFRDFLGECYMQLEISNKSADQFFTPSIICELMASIVEPNVKNENILEPCCGSGAMIISRAKSLLLKKIDYKETMDVEAIDLDLTCVKMTYIQLSLLEIKAKIIHGNAITNEVFDVFYTEKYIQAKNMKVA